MKVLVSDTSALVDLERLPTAHVGPGLRQRHADMPWRIACRRRAGHPPRPHVLLTLEFQATVDRHMPLRVEIYTALLRQDLLREGHLVGPDRELPRVLPVVVHTGRERWSAPLSVCALTAPGPEAITPLQPEARYMLLDGRALPDDDARRNQIGPLHEQQRKARKRTPAGSRNTERRRLTSICRTFMQQSGNVHRRIATFHGETRMTTITPLDAVLGAEIRGVDVGAGVDDALMRALTGALYAHRVIVIRDQRLDEDRYLRFGRQWGTPIPHVLDHMRMSGYPEMMTVGNTEKRDEDPKIRNGAALWHTDQSYEKAPASATMLYSIIAPERGGETQYCDMAAAYDNLDAETRRRIDGLEVAHRYGRGKRRPGEPPVNPIIDDEQDRRVPPVHHPLVMRHPITGRKALYALGHGAYAVKGMPDDEAVALLDALKNHALQERHVYRHKYSVGDLVVWDTLQTMHAATPIDVATSKADSRLLWRISVRGRPTVHAAAVVAA